MKKNIAPFVDIRDYLKLLTEELKRTLPLFPLDSDDEQFPFLINSFKDESSSYTVILRITDENRNSHIDLTLGLRELHDFRSLIRGLYFVRVWITIAVINEQKIIDASPMLISLKYCEPQKTALEISSFFWETLNKNSLNLDLFSIKNHR